MGSRPPVAPATALALALAAGCSGSFPPPPAAPSGSAEVLARDHAFEPAVLRAAAGRPIVVALRNAGQAPHTFTIRELDVDLVVAAGRVGTVAFTPAAPGRLRFVCTLHLAAGMTGTLDLRPSTRSG